MNTTKILRLKYIKQTISARADWLPFAAQAGTVEKVVINKMRAKKKKKKRKGATRHLEIYRLTIM